MSLYERRVLHRLRRRRLHAEAAWDNRDAWSNHTTSTFKKKLAKCRKPCIYVRGKQIKSFEARIWHWTKHQCLANARAVVVASGKHGRDRTSGRCNNSWTSVSTKRSIFSSFQLNFGFSERRGWTFGVQPLSESSGQPASASTLENKWSNAKESTLRCNRQLLQLWSNWTFAALVKTHASNNRLRLYLLPKRPEPTTYSEIQFRHTGNV